MKESNVFYIDFKTPPRWINFISSASSVPSFQIKEYLSDLNIKISNLATGIPIGGELNYIDEGTLKAAFDERK